MTVNVVEAKSKTMIYNWKRGNNADPIINVIPRYRDRNPRDSGLFFSCHLRAGIPHLLDPLDF